MLQIENESLRDYVSNLQTTLVSASIEVPEPPSTLSISKIPAPRNVYAPNAQRDPFVRATSLEVREISDAALLRQREGDARGRLGQQRPPSQNGPSSSGASNGLLPPAREAVKDANIEPSLLEQSRRAAAQAA